MVFLNICLLAHLNQMAPIKKKKVKKKKHQPTNQPNKQTNKQTKKRF